MSWWRGQGLGGPLHGPDGEVWHFLVWHGAWEGAYVQRIYFWDETKRETGLVELRGDQTLHVSKLRDRERKVARDAGYRQRWLQPLAFPLERYWPET